MKATGKPSRNYFNGDITITPLDGVSNVYFHSKLLMNQSTYFKRLLQLEPKRTSFHVYYDLQTVCSVKEFVYTGYLDFKCRDENWSHNVYDLIQFADEFQLQSFADYLSALILSLHTPKVYRRTHQLVKELSIDRFTKLKEIYADRMLMWNMNGDFKEIAKSAYPSFKDVENTNYFTNHLWVNSSITPMCDLKIKCNDGRVLTTYAFLLESRSSLLNGEIWLNGDGVLDLNVSYKVLVRMLNYLLAGCLDGEFGEEISIQHFDKEMKQFARQYELVLMGLSRWACKYFLK